MIADGGEAIADIAVLGDQPGRCAVPPKGPGDVVAGLPRPGLGLVRKPTGHPVRDVDSNGVAGKQVEPILPVVPDERADSVVVNRRAGVLAHESNKECGGPAFPKKRQALDLLTASRR